YLYNALARLLIQNGDVDFDFISQHTEGFEKYRDSVFQYSVEEAAAKCEIPVHKIKLAASYIAAAKGFLTLWAMGLNQSVIGVKKNFALISLNLITGHIGKPGSGPFSLTGQPNAMGGREVGGMATMLAAHRSIANEQHRKEVAAFWNVESISSRPGLTATKMIEALEEGRLKALWIVCTNPLVSLPDINRVEAAMRKARFIVVQDISKNSDTIHFADLILPAAGHFEKEGTMTNSERRISHLAKIIDPPGEALPDSEIIQLFANTMGFHGFNYNSAEEIFNEHAALTRGTNIDISGLTYLRLKERSIQWPVPDQTSEGTSRLFTNHEFYTPSRKAKLFPLNEPENLSEPVTSAFPLILTTGRIRDQWHTMTKTGKVNKLLQHDSKPFLEINPHDAGVRGIRENDVVVISNARGTTRVRARITGDIKEGVVFLPMHWGKAARANNLTSNKVDPVSQEPDFKFSAVEVTPFKKPVEKIIVVGAGAAAFRFICTYRELNSEDHIQVFSNEKYPFYNRVLLPEYVNDSLDWNKLKKFQSGEFEKLNVAIELDNEIVEINRKGKFVVDKKGKKSYYDKLILATGARANVPKDAPLSLPGIFTMRTRYDADQLKKFLPYKGSVLIVGGGLLGIELASALRDIDVEVSILQLGSRLMERQIDNLGGQLLLDFIEDRNITVYMNDQIQSVNRDELNKKLNAHLRSDRVLSTDAIIYAVGTKPNIEFAQEAGLESARGIIVSDYLQTSDPDIFAIGEIGEHRGKLLGITAAAEKQADALANYFYGDLQSQYDGAVSMNILKLSGLDLCSIGIVDIPEDSGGYEEILFI
ncbi:MAG TPA: FAD-dependent oxidoreductase, partial [Cyclobacteriaceae bacterium]|nr:FAD-dependent oxidoreductase [Cyclobacteriaceae bacterium]